ncbi:DUF3800 domain-containing protein [Desulfurobacterium sp. TC5-1]|uniref:DUF3800 domain-containing protein n=1 Tax=Desulfurobacterium sp. TC5-1 TaxID=1158318 RepID=UPI0003B74768|nr:DUF3800 domain-containing protein [Desulfurobacterium sp. TC5-1]
MFLVYTDESGKELKKNEEGFYRDGPCFLYGGLAVEVEKHHLIENAFKSMCKEILGINNIYETEIHTGDIFYGRKQFKDLDFEKKKDFFKEVLQLLAKFNVPLILGLVYKDTNLFRSDLEKISSAIYAFFYALDSFLLQRGKYGLVIADELEKDIKSIKELLNRNSLTGRKGGIKLSFLIRRVYFEKLNRFGEYSFEPIISLKYKFESQIYAVIDNIHYVNSSFSIFNQLSDIVLFLFNIALEFQETEGFFVDKGKLFEAIAEDFLFFLSKTKSIVTFLCYRKKAFDVMFGDFYLSGFRAMMETLKKEQANGT